MFKVECLGCQAPYQVDERRIPEKGLKMRCPKCGTSFKVEPPSPAVGAELPGSEISESVPEPPPVAAFTTAGVPAGARSAFHKGGGREALARTMIGVAAGQGAAEGGQARPFKVPRPNDAAAPRGDWAALSVGDTVVVAGTEPPPSVEELELGTLTDAAPEDAELPAVVASRRAFAEPGFAPGVPTSGNSSGQWLAAEPLSDSPPESLVEPSSPLSLSELPQPLAAPRAPGKPALAFQPSAEAASLELDYGGDLPTTAVVRPPRKPPPRRPRAEEAVASTDEAGLDLPARLEELDRRARVPAAPRAQPVAVRPAAVPKSSSLDGVGLPAVIEPKAPRRAVTELTDPLAASGHELDQPDLPAVGPARSPATARQAARPLHDDLPDVFRSGPAFSSDDLPDLSGTGLPDVQGTGLPAVAEQGLPELASAGLPDVLGAGLPDVQSAGLPDVQSAGLPTVQGAGLPDVLAVGLPTVTAAGLPAPREAELPEVSASGGRGFGRVDLPVAREAGLPEVRGGLEIDLPGVGESLPALVGDELNLPLVGETLPTTKGGRARRQSSADDLSDAFGPELDDGDPFAGSEADFGAMEARDGSFSADDGAAGLGGREPGSYGEVDIAGDASEGAPLETADDMEFRAIPQRSSTPPARAAASATVHADAADSEAAGSTLELAPKRTPRPKSRRWIAAGLACAGVIAGGALALKPAIGPFGIHFILDQVHRPEHERMLTELIEQARKSAALDTFRATEEMLQKFEQARKNVPRFEPLAERSAYAHYAAARRFGPLPQNEAVAKTALDAVDAESNSAGLRLARAARDAVERSSEAKAALEAVGSAEARELLGELLLERGDWEAARKLWSSLLEGAPQNARAAFGLARAELGAKNTERAVALAREVLEHSPEHVGAHILRLDAERVRVSSGAKAGAGSDALVAKVMAALGKAGPGEAALAHAVLGELHLAQGRSAPAQQSFEEALSISRNLPRALVGLGETLHLAGRHGEALARFKSAAQADPGSLAAQLGIVKSEIHLGHLPEAKAALKALETQHKTHPELIYWSARAEQAAGAHDAAIAAYRASIQAAGGRPQSVEAYLALAKLETELGQLAAAQQTLAEARQKLPPSGALHKALGEVAMSRGQYTEAHDQFEKALELDTGDTRARFLGAVALARLGRFEEALAAFQRVGETDKDFPGLAVERGRLFEDSGRITEALNEYEAALKAAPEDVDLQGRVGCSRVVAGKARDALELLGNVVKARPRSAEASFCLGRAYLEEERYMDAIVRLERAVSLEPTRALYHLYVGWAANEVGRSADAETALAQALSLDKGLADAYWQRGRLLLKQGAVKDALRDLEQALALKPNRREALADLAVAYSDLGRMSKAAKAWEDALVHDPDNATWHFRYGKLLGVMGKGPEAAAHLRRALDIVSEAQRAAPAEQQAAPLWLWQAHYLLARELGRVGAAVVHWQAYMRLSPQDDPYRSEAEHALAELGQPWQER